MLARWTFIEKPTCAKPQNKFIRKKKIHKRLILLNDFASINNNNSPLLSMSISGMLSSFKSKRLCVQWFFSIPFSGLQLDATFSQQNFQSIFTDRTHIRFTQFQMSSWRYFRVGITSNNSIKIICYSNVTLKKCVLKWDVVELASSVEGPREIAPNMILFIHTRRWS